MQRATARLVLLILLLGVILPAANAVGMDQTPACCRRKPMQSAMAGMPHCHEMAAAVSDSDVTTTSPSEHAISSNSCASHECCRSLARSQWAQVAQSPVTRNLATLTFDIASRASGAPRVTPSNDHSGRAPPTL